ncbi:methyltransferase domain-containing protein [Uliginosibacterium gangwonense]|uniref:methyltransferase domain-containing protein n=1 Tax=Uliginosibacterium gangwonense TaxID=392736 RepID=UPI000367BA46|nr:methyltransferase domain-containing protein [Uliginosibacterium gangwonense]
MSKNILLVMLEFDNWQQARAWSYTGAWAFQDGLEENGHRCTVLPAIWGRAPDAADSFIHHAESILGDTHFDEAWVWCVHTQYDAKFWQWLKRVAPRRIGITMESLSVAPQEAVEFPHFAKRQDEVLEQLSHCTHAIVADEADTTLVQNRLGIPATWNVVMVPERFVRFDAAPEHPRAAFIGNKYGERVPYLEDAALGDLLYRPHLPERDTDRPQRFDAIHQDIRAKLLAGKPDLAMLQQSTLMMKLVREALFRLHLDGIRMGFANVNLPSMLKAYAGRVTESMAAATPAVSWLPPDRPACAKLFKAGEEIELFSSPTELQAHLTALATDSERRNRQVIAARNTLLNRHTTRIRLRQYTNWLDQGISPDFFGDIGYKPTVEESLYYKHFFAEDKHWSLPTPNGDERARWEKIQAMIERIRATENAPLSMVEIGCGRGWMSNLCSQYGAVLGVEPVGDVIHHAQALFPNLQFLTGNADLLHFLGFGGFFDLLVCSEVIEHLPYAEKAAFVTNLVGLVKPGGHLIITTPRMDIYPQWSEKFGTPPQPTEDWLTEAQVEAHFREAGCTPLDLQRAFLLDIYQVWLFQHKYVHQPGSQPHS